MSSRWENSSAIPQHEHESASSPKAEHCCQYDPMPRLEASPLALRRVLWIFNDDLHVHCQRDDALSIRQSIENDSSRYFGNVFARSREIIDLGQIRYRQVGGLARFSVLVRWSAPPMTPLG